MEPLSAQPAALGWGPLTGHLPASLVKPTLAALVGGDSSPNKTCPDGQRSLGTHAHAVALSPGPWRTWSLPAAQGLTLGLLTGSALPPGMIWNVPRKATEVDLLLTESDCDASAILFEILCLKFCGNKIKSYARPHRQCTHGMCTVCVHLPRPVPCVTQ